MPKLKTQGFIHLTLWAILIVLGIVVKRVYGYPNMMVFFHLPAAVFLVLGMRCFSANNRAIYERELSNYTNTNQ